MFYNTRIGARLGDLFMSIFYTCQLNKINPLHQMNTVCDHHAEVVDNPETVALLELPAGCLGDLVSRPHLRAIWFLRPSLSGVQISVDPQPIIHSPKRDLQDEGTQACRKDTIDREQIEEFFVLKWVQDDQNLILLGSQRYR
jgi:hypothetical protein